MYRQSENHWPNLVRTAGGDVGSGGPRGRGGAGGGE